MPTRYQDDLSKFFSQDLTEIRHELLCLKGIGPETADSILLYAGNYPTFVVDVYTKRICKRVPIKVFNDSYNGIKYFFENELQYTIPKKDLTTVYQELHALFVQSSGLIAGGSLAGVLYAILFGNGIVPEADAGDNHGLLPFLHDGTGGLIAGGLLFFALGVVLAKVGQRKLTK